MSPTFSLSDSSGAPSPTEVEVGHLPPGPKSGASHDTFKVKELVEAEALSQFHLSYSSEIYAEHFRQLFCHQEEVLC
jgi:hypothetical protein